ncbi:MAG TPA: HK97 family phage prohead protease [Devosia sp.]|nr:HK97 family phage prohead protease [Devosia sp.]
MAPIPIDGEGRFAGYASIFGALDEGGDVVMPGAFAKSLAARGRAGIRMLFQHDPKEPIGVWEKIVEDGFGLWVEGRLTGGVPRADALRRLIAARAIDGLSIGFRTVRSSREAASGHRRLREIDLWEISIVSFPMLPGARIANPSKPAPDRRLVRSLDAAISALRQTSH